MPVHVYNNTMIAVVNCVLNANILVKTVLFQHNAKIVFQKISDI